MRDKAFVLLEYWNDSKTKELRIGAMHDSVATLTLMRRSPMLMSVEPRQQ